MYLCVCVCRYIYIYTYIGSIVVYAVYYYTAWGLGCIAPSMISSIS